MKIHWARVRAVFWKDAIDLLKNRALLASMAALPLVLVVVPIAVVYSYVRNPDDIHLHAFALYYDASVTRADAARFLIERVLSDWFALFLMMPVFIPILISSQAVAGEKERRTLEPLLSTPLSPLELLLGKSFASLLPACLLSLAAFALLCVGVDTVTYPVFGQWLLPNTMWMFGVLVVAPLFAFFGNAVAVTLSARVGDSRLAQQLAGVCVMPLLGLAGGQFAGFLKAGTEYYLWVGVCALVANLALVQVCVRLFDRERLMTRWG